MFESLNEFLSWEPPQLKEIISHGILPAGGKLVIAGREGELKTMLSTYAGFCVSLGLPFIGFKTNQTRVCFLQAELTKAMFQERVSQLVLYHNTDLSQADIYFATALELKLNKPAGIAQLISALKNLRPGLLIIDPIYKVLQADISDWQEMSRLTDNLDYICREFNCALWLVHHRRKSQLAGEELLDMGTDELVGSSELKNWADTILRVSLRDNDVLTIEFPKVRNARTLLSPIDLQFDRQTLSFRIVGLSANDLKG